MQNIEPGNYVLRVKAFKADGSMQTCYSMKYYLANNEYLAKARSMFFKTLSNEGYTGMEITGVIFQPSDSRTFYPPRI